MADLSKYFVGQQVGLQPIPESGSVQPTGLQPLDRRYNQQLLQEAADKARAESDRINSPLGQAGIFASEAAKGLTSAFLRQPARFVASSVAAPFDIANQVQGKQSFTGEIPLLGRTFQGQAAVDQNRLFDKAYAGEKFTAGDYGTALRPFGEVPLAALETVSLAKGLGEARQVMKKSADLGKEKYLTDILTPTESTAKNSAYVKAIKTGRVEPAGVFKGRSVEPDQATLKIVEELKTVPGIKKGQELLKTTNAIHDEIGNTAKTLRSAIINRDVQPTIEQADIKSFIDGVKTSLKESPYETVTGDVGNSADKILNQFVARLPKDRPATAIDILDARQGLDKWMGAQKGGTIFDPARESAVSIALRAVRQGANELLAEKAQDVAVREMLLRQTRLYDAIDAIAVKAAKEGGLSVAAKVLNPLWNLTKKAAGAAAVLGAAYAGSSAQKALGE